MAPCTDVLWTDRLTREAGEASTVVAAVDPRDRPRPGHACGAIDPRPRRSQAAFVGVVCGHRDHADVDAAKNILRLGRSLQAPAVDSGHAVA